MRALVRILLGGLLAVAALVIVGSAASAQVPGDPVGTDVSPHGGYSASTNMCRQCHSVHNAASEYALLWKDSVTATCETCHSLFTNPATGTRTPVSGSGTIVGTAAARSAYENADPESQHPIGEDGVDGNAMTESGWVRSGFPPTTNSPVAAGPGTSSADEGGLYCASCHTPHGDYGQVVNKWTSPADDNRAIYWNPAGSRSWRVGYLKLDTTRANADRGIPGVWQVCTESGGTTCEDALVDDADGSTSGDAAYLYGYKLLSKYPNHTYSSAKTYATESYGHDGAPWCESCHTNKADSDGNHLHPTACTTCHGNKSTGTIKDFPHTGENGSLLSQLPDALCVSCHANGGVP